MGYGDPQQFARQCAGKWPHDTLEEAEAEAKRRASRWPQAGYACDYCGYYHSGHVPSWMIRLGVA